MRGLLACAGFVIVSALSCPAAGPEGPIGYVARVEGNWRDSTCDCKVDRGYSLLKSSRITRRPPVGPGDYLAVRFVNDGGEERFDCRGVNCDAPLDVAMLLPRHQNATALGEWLRAALDVVKENLLPGGDRSRTLSGFARTLSRATSQPLSDAILFSSRDGVDVSAVFGRAAPGHYAIEWCPVSETGSQICPPVPKTEVAGLGSGERNLWPHPMQAGIYEIFVCTRAGTRQFRGESAIVLVAADEAQALLLRPKLDRFLQSTATWDAAERSMLAHAYMESLYAGGRQ